MNYRVGEEVPFGEVVGLPGLYHSMFIMLVLKAQENIPCVPSLSEMQSISFGKLKFWVFFLMTAAHFFKMPFEHCLFHCFQQSNGPET